MSINICPCCNGKCNYIDFPGDKSYFLCIGCEIVMYKQINELMDCFKISKEQAYELLKNKNN